jgi:hypothetical protein
MHIPTLTAKSNTIKNSILDKIDVDIISTLLLEFNHTRDHINIYFHSIKIGNIKLDLSNVENSIIKLIHIEINMENRKKGMAFHSIFVLMEIIAAYYAPTTMSLIFEPQKEMNSIAYKLQFQMTSLEKTKHIFIRKCRI